MRANTTGGGNGNGSVQVSVTPPNASVFLGATQQFQANVTGSSDEAVTWEVNGADGGSTSTGTISVEGLYTAPTTMPAGGSITVTAVSAANLQDSGSASVTLKANNAVTVTPNPATVPTSGAQVFTATMGPGSSSTTLNWSVNQIAGGNATVGTVVSTGATTAVYTAPPAPPSPATVTVTATNAADASSSGSASVTISCNPANGMVQFDGTFGIERLPVGHIYSIYAEPLVGPAAPADFSEALNDLCSGATLACVTPAVNTNFNPRMQPAGP